MTGGILPERAVTEHLVEVHKRLSRSFSAPAIHHADRLGPVSQLVDAIIADGVHPDRADAAFRSLCATYHSWPDIRDAPEASIRRCLGEVNLNASKSATIKRALDKISGASSWPHPSLDFLGPMEATDAVSWLSGIEGISSDIAARVLLLSSLHRGVLPVDPAHQRVAERIGLIPAGLEDADAQAHLNRMLPGNWRPSDVEEHYFFIRAHARRDCVARYPKCRPCPIRDLCAHATR